MTEKTAETGSSNVEDGIDTSRRSMMKSAAIAGLAMASLPASAESITAQAPGDVQPLIDPRTRFPNDQPTQAQAWPGL
jgi:hypothetical protein